MRTLQVDLRACLGDLWGPYQGLAGNVDVVAARLHARQHDRLAVLVELAAAANAVRRSCACQTLAPFTSLSPSRARDRAQRTHRSDTVDQHARARAHRHQRRHVDHVRIENPDVRALPRLSELLSHRGWCPPASRPCPRRLSVQSFLCVLVCIPCARSGRPHPPRTLASLRPAAPMRSGFPDRPALARTACSTTRTPVNPVAPKTTMSYGRFSCAISASKSRAVHARSHRDNNNGGKLFSKSFFPPKFEHTPHPSPERPEPRLSVLSLGSERSLSSRPGCH